MTNDRKRRSPGRQPELPLAAPAGGISHHGASQTQGTERREKAKDWHLDEHTRRIGRQGVAEARARLAQATTGRSDHKEDDQRRVRRAA